MTHPIDGGTRVAALYDIHGNLPALEAALAAVDAAGAEMIVVGGDVALGPMPRETIDRLAALGSRAHYVRGNCDRLVVDAFDGLLSLPARTPSSVRETFEWTAAQLDRRRRDFLARSAPTVSLAIDGVGDVLFCHATPRSDEEIVTARTPDARMREVLDGVSQPVVVCGHTHMQFDRAVGGARLVNAGSVGMPYGSPGAYWLLLGPDVELRRADYDLARAAARVRATSYPQAAEFASRSVLRPQSEEEILALFEPPPADAAGHALPENG